MKRIFLDESGDHNLDPDKVDPAYPLFVLCGCIFEEEYYKKVVIKKFNQFKKEYFKDETIILHYLEMTRPSKTKNKQFLKFNNKDFRVTFYKALNTFFEELEFTIAACIIKKQPHLEKYGVSALDPYLLSFNDLVNEFIFELGENEKGKIIAEKRNSILDKQLDFAWLNIALNGIEQFSGSEIKEKITKFHMIPKAQNEAGLQIADLIASSIGRHVLKLKNRPGQEVDFKNILEKKLRSSGLTILPK